MVPFSRRPTRRISLFKRLREAQIDRTGYAKGKNDSEMQILRGTWDICLVGGAAELPVTTETVGYASNLFLVFPRTAFAFLILFLSAFVILILVGCMVWQCQHTPSRIEHPRRVVQERATILNDHSSDSFRICNMSRAQIANERFQTCDITLSILFRLTRDICSELSKDFVI